MQNASLKARSIFDDVAQNGKKFADFSTVEQPLKSLSALYRNKLDKKNRALETDYDLEKLRISSLYLKVDQGVIDFNNTRSRDELAKFVQNAEMYGIIECVIFSEHKGALGDKDVAALRKQFEQFVIENKISINLNVVPIIDGRDPLTLVTGIKSVNNTEGGTVFRYRDSGVLHSLATTASNEAIMKNCAEKNADKISGKNAINQFSYITGEEGSGADTSVRDNLKRQVCGEQSAQIDVGVATAVTQQMQVQQQVQMQVQQKVATPPYVDKVWYDYAAACLHTKIFHSEPSADICVAVMRDRIAGPAPIQAEQIDEALRAVFSGPIQEIDLGVLQRIMENPKAFLSGIDINNVPRDTHFFADKGGKLSTVNVAPKEQATVFDLDDSVVNSVKEVSPISHTLINRARHNELPGKIFTEGYGSETLTAFTDRKQKKEKVAWWDGTEYEINVSYGRPSKELVDISRPRSTQGDLSLESTRQNNCLSIDVIGRKLETDEEGRVNIAPGVHYRGVQVQNVTRCVTDYDLDHNNPNPGINKIYEKSRHNGVDLYGAEVSSLEQVLAHSNTDARRLAQTTGVNCVTTLIVRDKDRKGHFDAMDRARFRVPYYEAHKITDWIDKSGRVNEGKIDGVIRRISAITHITMESCREILDHLFSTKKLGINDLIYNEGTTTGSHLPHLSIRAKAVLSAYLAGGEEALKQYVVTADKIKKLNLPLNILGDADSTGGEIAGILDSETLKLICNSLTELGVVGSAADKKQDNLEIASETMVAGILGKLNSSIVGNPNPMQDMLALLELAKSIKQYVREWHSDTLPERDGNKLESLHHSTVKMANFLRDNGYFRNFTSSDKKYMMFPAGLEDRERVDYCLKLARGPEYYGALMSIMGAYLAHHMEKRMGHCNLAVTCGRMQKVLNTYKSMHLTPPEAILGLKGLISDFRERPGLLMTGFGDSLANTIQEHKLAIRHGTKLDLEIGISTGEGKPELRMKAAEPGQKVYEPAVSGNMFEDRRKKIDRLILDEIATCRGLNSDEEDKVFGAYDTTSSLVTRSNRLKCNAMIQIANIDANNVPSTKYLGIPRTCKIERSFVVTDSVSGEKQKELRKVRSIYFPSMRVGHDVRQMTPSEMLAKGLITIKFGSPTEELQALRIADNAYESAINNYRAAEYNRKKEHGVANLALYDVKKQETRNHLLKDCTTRKKGVSDKVVELLLRTQSVIDGMIMLGGDKKQADSAYILRNIALNTIYPISASGDNFDSSDPSQGRSNYERCVMALSCDTLDIPDIGDLQNPSKCTPKIADFLGSSSDKRAIDFDMSLCEAFTGSLSDKPFLFLMNSTWISHCAAILQCHENYDKEIEDALGYNTQFDATQTKILELARCSSDKIAGHALSLIMNKAYLKSEDSGLQHNDARKFIKGPEHAGKVINYLMMRPKEGIGGNLANILTEGGSLPDNLIWFSLLYPQNNLGTQYAKEARNIAAFSQFVTNVIEKDPDSSQMLDKIMKSFVDIGVGIDASDKNKCILETPEVKFFIDNYSVKFKNYVTQGGQTAAIWAGSADESKVMGVSNTVKNIIAECDLQEKENLAKTAESVDESTQIVGLDTFLVGIDKGNPDSFFKIKSYINALTNPRVIFNAVPGHVLFEVTKVQKDLAAYINKVIASSIKELKTDENRTIFLHEMIRCVARDHRNKQYTGTHIVEEKALINAIGKVDLNSADEIIDAIKACEAICSSCSRATTQRDNTENNTECRSKYFKCIGAAQAFGGIKHVRKVAEAINQLDMGKNKKMSLKYLGDIISSGPLDNPEALGYGAKFITRSSAPCTPNGVWNTFKYLHYDKKSMETLVDAMNMVVNAEGTIFSKDDIAKVADLLFPSDGKQLETVLVAAETIISLPLQLIKETIGVIGAVVALPSNPQDVRCFVKIASRIKNLKIFDETNEGDMIRLLSKIARQNHDTIFSLHTMLSRETLDRCFVGDNNKRKPNDERAAAVIALLQSDLSLDRIQKTTSMLDGYERRYYRWNEELLSARVKEVVRLRAVDNNQLDREKIWRTETVRTTKSFATIAKMLTEGGVTIKGKPVAVEALTDLEFNEAFQTVRNYLSTCTDRGSESYQMNLLLSMALSIDAYRRKVGFVPNEAQMVAIINRFDLTRTNPNTIMRLDTGQGKSLMSTIIGLTLFATGQSVNVLTSSPALAHRDAMKNSPICDLVGATSCLIESGSSWSTYKPGGFLYSDYDTFGTWIPLQVVEDPSHVMPSTPGTISTIADEIDQLLKLNPPYCVANELKICEGIPYAQSDYESLLENVMLKYVDSDHFKNNRNVTEEQDYENLLTYIDNLEVAREATRSKTRDRGLELARQMADQAVRTDGDPVRAASVKQTFKTLIADAAKAVALYAEEGSKWMVIDDTGSDGIECRKVVPVIASIPQKRSSFVGSVNNCLAILVKKAECNAGKHIVLDTPRAVTYVDGPNDMCDRLRIYGSVTGLTGTVGAGESVKELADVNGFDILHFPRQEVDKGNAPEYIITKTQEEQFNMLKKTIKAKMRTGQPIIVVDEDAGKATAMFNKLKEEFGSSSNYKFVRSVYASDDEFKPQDLEKLVGQDRWITIASPHIGRGFDATCKHKDGLAIIGLTINLTEDQKQQIDGRTARNGAKGDRTWILDSSEMQKKWGTSNPEEIMAKVSAENARNRHKEEIHNGILSYIAHNKAIFSILGIENAQLIRSCNDAWGIITEKDEKTKLSTGQNEPLESMESEYLTAVSKIFNEMGVGKADIVADYKKYKDQLTQPATKERSQKPQLSREFLAKYEDFAPDLTPYAFAPLVLDADEKVVDIDRVEALSNDLANILKRAQIQLGNRFIKTFNTFTENAKREAQTILTNSGNKVSQDEALDYIKTMIPDALSRDSSFMHKLFRVKNSMNKGRIAVVLAAADILNPGILMDRRTDIINSLVKSGQLDKKKAEDVLEFTLSNVHTYSATGVRAMKAIDIMVSGPKFKYSVTSDFFRSPIDFIQQLFSFIVMFLRFTPPGKKCCAKITGLSKEVAKATDPIKIEMTIAKALLDACINKIDKVRDTDGDDMRKSDLVHSDQIQKLYRILCEASNSMALVSKTDQDILNSRVETYDDLSKEFAEKLTGQNAEVMEKAHEILYSVMSGEKAEAAFVGKIAKDSHEKASTKAEQIKSDVNAVAQWLTVMSHPHRGEDGALEYNSSAGGIEEVLAKQEALMAENRKHLESQGADNIHRPKKAEDLDLASLVGQLHKEDNKAAAEGASGRKSSIIDEAESTPHHTPKKQRD